MIYGVSMDYPHLPIDCSVLYESMVNNRKVPFRVKLVIAFTIVLCISTFHLSQAQTFNVKRAIDGDTIQLSGGEIVRLIGVDTPETKQ